MHRYLSQSHQHCTLICSTSDGEMCGDSDDDDGGGGGDGDGGER